MAVSPNVLSKDQVHSILDKFSQLKEGGKLCFKGDEIAIESSSSLLRTGASWLSYAIGSEWSRDISNLTVVVQKLAQFSFQDVDGKEVIILANKTQEAIKGLTVLGKSYVSQPLKMTDVSCAIGNLRCFDQKLKRIIERNDQEIAERERRIQDLETQNASLQVQLQTTQALAQGTVYTATVFH